MAQGKKAWSPKKKDRQASNWTKARKREEDRIKAHPHSQNVAPGAHNGKSIDGYTITPTDPETIARRKINSAAKAKRITNRTQVAAA